MTEERLKQLILRLKKARCWNDETSYGTRCTKWFHLSPADVDMAIEVLL